MPNIHPPVPPEQWPPLNLSHLRRLTDETGLIQHALYSLPDLATGYTTDDNARALAVATRLQAAGFDVSDLVTRYLALLYYLQDEHTGLFWHGLDYSRRMVGGVGGEDTQGRALLACATVMRPTAAGSLAAPTVTTVTESAPYAGIHSFAPGQVARRMWRRALAGTGEGHSPWEYRYPRGQALALLALATHPQVQAEDPFPATEADAHTGAGPGHRDLRQVARDLGEQLVAAYRHTAGPGWHWFEEILTYANAILPHGLLAAYQLTEVPAFLTVATDALDFLLEVSFPEGYLRVVGNRGWYPRDGKRALFDEQPVDAGHLVECCLEAYRLSGHHRYLEAARQAMAWFHGTNALGIPLYQAATGAVYDGLGPDGPNLNQGAESVLSYLSARLSWL